MRRALFLGILLLFGTLTFPFPTHAADLRTTESISLSETQTLQNAYLIGKEISSKAKITDDLVALGGDITINGSTSGSIMAAGGNITLNGAVGNSIRVVGGTLTINGDVKRDVVVMGGTVIITKTAKIGGDLLFAGGTLQVDGPVQGKVLVNGSAISISSKIGKNVEGNMGTLQLKDGAEIFGDLDYTSSQKGLISDGSIIRGQEIYHMSERKEVSGLSKLLDTGTLIKLTTDIFFSLLLIYIFPGITSKILSVLRKKPLKSGLIGAGFLFLVPIIAVFLLILLWLGVTVGLIYMTYAILALMIAKIFVGFLILSWIEKRNKKEYNLDWRSGVIGPIIVALLFLIPVIGWLIGGILYLISLGGLGIASLELRTIKK